MAAPASDLTWEQTRGLREGLGLTIDAMGLERLVGA